MKITQMKFQRIVVKSVVILSAIALFYWLAVFATPFYQFEDIVALNAFNDDLLKASGLYLDIQPFNRVFFTIGIINFLITLSLLVFFGQSRRKYYLSNYITSAVSAVTCFLLSIYSLIIIFIFRVKFKAISFDAINSDPIIIDNLMSVNSSAWSFDIGVIIFVLLTLASAALAFNIFWKRREMKIDAETYFEIDAKIYAEWAQKEQELLEEAEKYES